MRETAREKQREGRLRKLREKKERTEKQEQSRVEEETGNLTRREVIENLEGNRSRKVELFPASLGLRQ